MWYKVFRQKLKREICFYWDLLIIYLNNFEMERKVFIIILIFKCYVFFFQGYDRSYFLWVMKWWFKIWEYVFIGLRLNVFEVDLEKFYIWF